MSLRSKGSVGMSGKRYFLDTNAIIQLLKGNTQLVNLLVKADYVAISVISRLEFLSFSGLTDNDRNLYERFEKQVTSVGLSVQDDRLLDNIIETRINSALKLPDSIILAKANANDCILVTADKQLLAQASYESMGFELI